MGKVLDLESLAAKVSKARANGKTVVFTNGAFDLIHVGHIRYLQGAAELGDLLLCAINSDKSVQLLKGDKRPIMPLDERLEIVAAIECVDFVTSFDEPNVENLLRTIKPDIHAKGTDYTEDTVPEVEVVRSYGGKVAITGDPKDHNTTDIISTILEKG